MRYIATLTLLAIGLISRGQSMTKHSLNLNEDLISQIKISSYCDPMDSCQSFTYKLTNSMKDNLVDRLNQSDSIGLCKFTNEYWLHIYFTDSTIRSYISNGVLFSEVKKDDTYPFYITKAEDDLCLKIKEPNYIFNLWLVLDQDRKK